MREDIESCKTLDELFDIWQNGENHDIKTFVRDGIVKFGWGSKKKILFILKEAYLKKDENGEVQDCKHDVRDWLSDEKGFCELLNSKYKNVWRRIVEWTYCINETNETKIASFPSDLFEGENKRVVTDLINSVAVINLKKSSGKAVSDPSELNKYSNDDREFIQKQIELISPDIIVCGFTLDFLDKNVYDKEIKSKPGKNDDWFYYTKKISDKEILIIDFYHPAARKTKIENWENPETRYCKLAECYQKALLSKIKK